MKLLKILPLSCAAIISVEASNASAQSSPSPVISIDSTYSVELPAGFQPVLLNQQAQLQFVDTIAGAYFMAIVEPRADLVGWNLTRHSMITLAQLLTAVDNPEVTGPDRLEIGGNRAVQHVVEGVSQGTRIAYLHTTIESPAYYAQLVLWTPGSGWTKNESMLRAIVASWRTTDAPPRSLTAYDIVPGTWIWISDPQGCSGNTQTFAISADRKTMSIQHKEPYEAPDGSMKSITEYVIEGSSPKVLNTFIPDDSRRTDDGRPVKWDLVALAQNRLTWHRTDWPEGGYTGMLMRCGQN